MGKNDQFANIAIAGIHAEGKGLKMPVPEEIEQKPLPLQKGAGAERRIKNQSIRTQEELRRELDRKKAYYRPFLQRLTPTLPSLRERKTLERFSWRVETEQDRQEFQRVLLGEGQWEEVVIPHYGAPLGKAAACYRTIFQMEALEADRSVFLHFCGVDYRAQVFVFGSCAGTHEGFFAPFECDITDCLKEGENILVVRVENDFVQKRSSSEPEGRSYGGDKLYAATGPGYDDPAMGWHHCPPGMGIYQDVWLEVRSRCFVQDIFVRPILEESRAEAWIRVFTCDQAFEDVYFELSLYGRNFKHTVFENRVYVPETERQVGMGDTFTEANLIAGGQLHKPVHMYMEKGANDVRIPFDIPDCRKWEWEEPWLYELQVAVKRRDGMVLDTERACFGMRSFTMDTEHIPKGGFFFNGRSVKLRGANTMGHEQQCVMKKDWNQLEEDLLLAKICNMNFLRLTQRPVQEEVYEMCDCLGLMTQTDLPLFGVLRIPMFTEALRQVEEMERLVRRHPCNIMVSYINEPFPNADNQPHRHLDREGLNRFFDCADMVVRQNNPDRVIKHVDGDYDPPSRYLPDNHCYTCWYNGCGIPSGALHKGYWLPVKEDWNYGCGEFGAEGLDFEEVMKKYYPSEWLAGSETVGQWSPSQIVGAQTGNFYHFFYDTPDTLGEWIEKSQKHQAWATKWMAEAFRRSGRMVSFAIHLFIDAFPAGWMKAIMDCERRPKPAYFAYRDALAPIMVSLRTDRYGYTDREEAQMEVWGCSDLPECRSGLLLEYQVCSEGRICFQGKQEVELKGMTASYLGSVTFPTEGLSEAAVVRTQLLDKNGEQLHYNEERIRIFSAADCKRERPEKARVWTAENNRRAVRLLEQMDISRSYEREEVVLLDSYEDYEKDRDIYDRFVEQGGRLIFLELPEGSFQIGDSRVEVKASCMMPMNFVSRKTGHPLAAGFEEEDFRNWYWEETDRIEPFLENTFTGESFTPILISGNTDADGKWQTVMAAGEMVRGRGRYLVCLLRLCGNVEKNPAAMLFAQRLLFGRL